MSDTGEALARSVRMSDSDYPGVLRCFGDAWRLSVSPDGRRYRLQPLAGGSMGWASPPNLVASSLSALCAKGAALVDGLAEACEGLPEDPALALSDLVAARAALMAEISGDRARAGVARRVRAAAFFAGKAETRAAEALSRSPRRGRVV